MMDLLKNPSGFLQAVQSLQSYLEDIAMTLHQINDHLAVIESQGKGDANGK